MPNDVSLAVWYAVARREHLIIYCEHEMYVDVTWRDKTLAVPLAQIIPLDSDEDSTEAVEDWHYWVNRGYTF
jgi:hypothetical protein